MDPKPTDAPTNLDPASLDTLDFVRNSLPADKATVAKPEPGSSEEFVKGFTEPKPEPAKVVEPEPVKAADPEPEPDDGLSAFAKSLLEDEPEPKPTDAVEPEPEPELTLPDNASTAAKDAFKKVNGDRSRLKAELKTIQAEKAELEKKVAEGDPTKFQAIQEELDATKTKFEEAQRVIKALDVKKSEEWKATIDTPMAALKEKANKLAEQYKLDGAAVRRLIASNDTAKLAEVLSGADVNFIDQGEFMKIRDNVHGLMDLQKNLEADADQASKMLTDAHKQRAEQFEAQKRVKFTTARDTTASNLQKNFPHLFQEVDGDTQWNEAVANTKGFLKNVDPTQLTADQMGEALAMAAMAPVAIAREIQSRKDLAIMAAKYKKMFKTNPKTEPGQVSQPATKKIDDGDTLGYVQAGLSKK